VLLKRNVPFHAYERLAHDLLTKLRSWMNECHGMNTAAAVAAARAVGTHTHKFNTKTLQKRWKLLK